MENTAADQAWHKQHSDDDSQPQPGIWQRGTSSQQPAASQFAVSSIPPGLMPQAPSRAFSRSQSVPRASQLQPSSPERNMAPAAAAATADQFSTLPRRTTQDNQNQRYPQGNIAGLQAGSSQEVPAIPRWVPPFRGVPQADTKSVSGDALHSSFAGRSLSEKPSR